MDETSTGVSFTWVLLQLTSPGWVRTKHWGLGTFFHTRVPWLNSNNTRCDTTTTLCWKLRGQKQQHTHRHIHPHTHALTQQSCWWWLNPCMVSLAGSGWVVAGWVWSSLAHSTYYSINSLMTLSPSLLPQPLTHSISVSLRPSSFH